MLHYDPVLNRQAECLPVARAATGIFLALKTLGLPGRHVIVPANLCYAGILPVVYADMIPAFCDVDAATGNVTYDTVISAAEHTTTAAAMIVPHMYGNPAADLPRISAYCKQHGIILIEDCASAMGAQDSACTPGSIGDYTVYSTGYSKTLDLGFGGLIVSSRPEMSRIEALEKELPRMTERDLREMAFFSRMYRLIRNEGTGTKLAETVYGGLASALKGGLISRLTEEERETILSGLSSLPDVITARRKALEHYLERITLNGQAEIYPYGKGAVPWRMNLLIPDPAV